MLLTARAHILMALRKIGQIRPGQQPGPELMQEMLDDWGLFFDGLSADLQAQFTNPDYEYPVTGPGSATNGNGYLVGPTGDWVGPRPEIILAANLVQTLAGSPPIYLPLSRVTQAQWGLLSQQQLNSALNVTSIFWYDPQFPNGVFNVFPPLNGNSIQLYESGVMTVPATLDDLYSAPPLYSDMVVWQLAMRNYYSMTKALVHQKAPYGVICFNAISKLDNIKMINRAAKPLVNDFKGKGSSRPGFYDSFVTQTGEPY